MRALLERVRTDFAKDVPADAPTQVVGIASRRLIREEDELVACVQNDGHAFYLLY